MVTSCNELAFHVTHSYLVLAVMGFSLHCRARGQCSPGGYRVRMTQKIV